MSRLSTSLAVAVGLAATGVGAARIQARRLASAPDDHDYDELAADVVGERVFVERDDGARIHTVVAGEGLDVVLLHGYGVSMIEWNLVQRDLLDRGHRVVCVDLRGHGRTTTGRDGITTEVVAADVAAVLDHHDVEDGVLVGHSTGGYVGIAMLVEHAAAAARLAGLLLVASLAGEASRDNPQNAVQIPLITSGMMQRMASTDVFGLPFAASIWGPDPSPAAMRVFLDTFIAQDHQALVPLLETMARSGYYARLGEIDLPTIVLHGAEDRTTPPWHQEALEAGIAGARRVVVPDAGHMLNWQAPDVVVQAITDLHAGDAAG